MNKIAQFIEEGQRAGYRLLSRLSENQDCGIYLKDRRSITCLVVMVRTPQFDYHVLTEDGETLDFSSHEII